MQATGTSHADLTEIFKYLDGLRESGRTNMFGAAPYVKARFNLPIEEAKRVLILWTRTFDGDTPPQLRAMRAINSQAAE